MKRRLSFVASAAALLTAGLSFAQNTLILSPQRIVDRASSLDVATVLTPQGWQVNSNVLWRLDHGQFVADMTDIFDPRSGAAVHFLPVEQFSVNPIIAASLRQQCRSPLVNGLEFVDAPLNALQYLQFIAVARVRPSPGIQITRGEELPGIAQAVLQTQQATIQAARQSGYQVSYNAARLRAEYTDPRCNQPIEEDFYCVIGNYQAQDGSQLLLPFAVYSFSALKGQLDAATPLLQSIQASYRSTLKWSAYVNNIDAMRKNAAIDDHAREVAANAEITQSQQQTFLAQCASADRIAEAVGDSIRGTQRFIQRSDGGADKEVILPEAYSRAFSDGQGNYIVTSDKSFNPQEQPNLQGTWTEMEMKPLGTR